jgi:hypothetical protein
MPDQSEETPELGLPEWLATAAVIPLSAQVTETRRFPPVPAA